jgi:hypothetical protein
MRNLHLILLLICVPLFGQNAEIVIDTPMPPPDWALAQHALLEANASAAEEFAAKYLDDRGFLRCVERWGGNDGPDDAMENFGNWTLAYALGAPESIIDLYKKAWEGHLIQYTRARVPNVEMAKDGMYYREFVTAFDWEHNGEGLAAFLLYGLGRPNDLMYRQRTLRFAGFYTGEDPLAHNYDPEHKIIRSIHNGSRGSKITPATVNDWGGEAVDGDPGRLERYSTASNIRGDHPLNLCATALAMNAYMLTHEAKYRNWLLEYSTAWRDRVIENNGNIPTNIGLNGQIGGEWDGKWYGGVFGWNFWPESTGRNYYKRGPRIAFGASLMLTGDQSFVEPLRRQIANLYAVKKIEDGRIQLPNKHGDDGWYGYTNNQLFDMQRDIYMWSMRASDSEHMRDDGWIAFLDGRNPDYPAEALRADLERVRRGVAGLRADTSTPDTRSSDYSQKFNPVATDSLVRLTLGGNEPGRIGNVLHSRLRYFDPEARRAGLPDGVGALVEKITPDEVTVTLVNTDPVHPRNVIVQSGAYGEHQCTEIRSRSRSVPVDAPYFIVRLAPGAGEKLRIAMKRYTNTPTLAFPW